MSLSGAWARAAAAVAVMATVLAWASPSGAQGGGHQLKLVSISPFVKSADVLRLQLRVVGPPADGLAIRVDRYDDISNNADPRRQLDEWATGRREVPRQAFGTVRVNVADLEGEFLSIPLGRTAGSTPPGGMTVTDAGVFPLVVSLLDANGTVLDDLRTFLIRPPDGINEPPLLVAPIIGLRAPVALRPDGTRALAPGDADRLSRAQTLLSTYPGQKLTVDPIPETVAALSGERSITPASLRAAIGDRQVLASTFVDVDVDQWVASGMRDQLERQRLLAIDALERDSVLDPAQPTDRGTWVARRPLDTMARSELQTLAGEPVPRIVVPEGAVSRVDDVDVGLQPFDITHPGGSVRAVVSDDKLSERLTGLGDKVLDAQATLAELAVLACGSRNGPGSGARGHCNSLPRTPRGVALVVPDDAEALDALSLLLQSPASATPLWKVTDLADVFRLPPATTGRGETLVRDYNTGPPAPGLGEYPRRLAATAERVRAYRSMLVAPEADPTADPPVQPLPSPEPGLPTDPADLLLQRLDVAGAAVTPGPRDAYLDGVDGELKQVFDAVGVPAHEAITLSSAEGDIYVTIENRLKRPVTVDVHLSSGVQLFEAAGAATRSTTVRQQIPQESSARVRVRVQTVTSGLSTVDVRVTSPEGGVLLGSRPIQVRSTVFSVVGLVLTVAAGVFLLVWWARHFRDARRARKLVGIDQVDTAVAMATGEVPVIGNDPFRSRV